MRLLVLVMAGIFSVAHAQSDTPASMQKLKILSWNIYMLPGFLGSGKLERADAIGQLLAASDYDVIVFQEAFHQHARNIISRHLQPAFPFTAGPANARLFSLKTNSGLWIFSRYPILQIASLEFKTRYGIDAMSRKGALLVELNVHGQKIQVIGTHLQNSGNEQLRQAQCTELFTNLLKKYQQPGVPQVVCGDFNIDRFEATETYYAMLQTLQAENKESAERMFTYDRVNNDLQVEKGTTRSLIDFILTRNNDGWLECSVRKVMRFRQRWHPQHQDLSDHYSVEAELSFGNPVQPMLVSLETGRAD